MGVSDSFGGILEGISKGYLREGIVFKGVDRFKGISEGWWGF